MNWSFLKKTEPRLVYLGIASFFVLTLLGSFLYVFRLPAQEYFRLRQDREFLANRLSADQSPAEAIAATKTRLDDLSRQLRGEHPSLPQNQLIALVIESLDSTAQAHGIQLTSLQPLPSRRIKQFEEIPFDVEVAGGFHAIREWLGAVEQMIGPLVIKSFTITGEGEHLVMRLSMASYRLADAAT